MIAENALKAIFYPEMLVDVITILPVLVELMGGQAFSGLGFVKARIFVCTSRCACL